MGGRFHPAIVFYGIIVDDTTLHQTLDLDVSQDVSNRRGNALDWRKAVLHAAGSYLSPFSRPYNQFLVCPSTVLVVLCSIFKP